MSSSSPVSPSDIPPQSISRYPSSSGHTDGSSYGGGYPSLHHPVPSASMAHIASMRHSQYDPMQPPPSYITGVLPPGTNPHDVDFRNFNAYIPNEVKHRKRTTRTQLRTLEDTFRINEKPPQALRQKLAEELNMTPRAVQVWFQNRRAKKKNVAKRAEKTGADGKPTEDGEDELDPSGSPSNRSLDGRGSATPPPSSTQPSPLDVVRPPQAFPIGASPDFYELRRGSLPIPALNAAIPSSIPVTPASAASTLSPSALPPSDAIGRRRSVDASLHRLANHPYAHVARQANGIYYGPRASVASGQVAPGFAQNMHLAATQGPQAVPDAAVYDMAGNANLRPPLNHHHASMPYAVPEHHHHHPYAAAQRVVSAGSGVRSRLHEYTVPERASGPLPSPTYTFGAGAPAEPVQSAGDLSQLHTFTFPPREDGGASDNTSAFVMPEQPPPFDYRYAQRFGSIAESEASFYSIASASGSTPPSQSHSEVDLLRRASVASIHDASWTSVPTYNTDDRKDSCASVNDAFASLIMNQGSHEDLAAYYSTGLPTSAPQDYNIHTATQAVFDETAHSRRPSLAPAQSQSPPTMAGNGIGSAAETMWPVDAQAAYNQALSRRQSVDLLAMQQQQQPTRMAQGQTAYSLAVAPAPSPQRSNSTSTSSVPSPPGQNAFQNMDPLGVFDPATFGFPQDGGAYMPSAYPGLDMNMGLGLGMGSELSTAMGIPPDYGMNAAMAVPAYT